jgi:hypothetical protein
MYQKMGSYTPFVLITLTSGLSFSTSDTQIKSIIIKSTPVITIKDLIKDNIVDIEMYENKVFALGKMTLYIFDKNKPQDVTKIKLKGLRDPQGFTIDSHGDIYFANTGESNIVKLSKISQYTGKPYTFGSKGSELGELNKPIDIAIDDGGVNVSLFVLEEQGDRLQVFTPDGLYKKHIDVSLTTKGSFVQPVNIVGAPRFIIADLGKNALRQFRLQGKDFVEKALFNGTLAGKISLSSAAVLIPEKDQVTSISLTDGTHTTIPLANTKQVADFENGFMAVIDKKSGYLSIIADPNLPESATAESIVKEFIAAIIQGDSALISKLSSGRKISARAFARDLPRFGNALSTMQGLEVTEYGDHALAVISMVIDGDLQRIELDLIFDNYRWSIL